MNTNTANSNYAHPEFDELMKDKSNQNCFDCGRGLVSWASVNNSVFLCINCAGIHRGFGVTVSYIRSITIDSWNDNQVSFIKAGGNERLKNLLNMYDVPADFPPENLYKTKLLEYYRNSIKSEVTKGVAPIPPKPEEALTSTVKERENTNNYSSVSSDVEDFGNIKNNYKSEKITKKNSIFSSVTGMLNGAYEKSKQVATNMKDKVVEMDIGTKIKTTGAKTVDILKDTTHVVVEKSTQVANSVKTKGSEVAKSDTVQNLKNKANEGYGFLKSKIWGTKAAEPQPTSDIITNQSENINQFTQPEFK